MSVIRILLAMFNLCCVFFVTGMVICGAYTLLKEALPDFWKFCKDLLKERELFTFWTVGMLFWLIVVCLILLIGGT